jgi:hypothetical protein
MRFWTREVAGWLLVGLGLFVFYVCFIMLTGTNHYILEAGPLTVIGIFLFRGGIHLLKVAVAARVCVHAQQRLERDPRAVPGAPRGRLSRPPATSVRRV